MIRAGELRERVTILTLTEKPDGSGWMWQEGKTTWARVIKTGKRSLFSSVGTSREEWAVAMRRQPLTLFQALRWRGKFLFLSDFTYPTRGHIEASTAMVEPVICSVRRTKVEKNELNNPSLATETDMDFPACLTERYERFSQGDTYAKTTRAYIAVCPKAISLRTGEVVTVGGDKFRVQVGYELSEYKNEYEIVREMDA